MHLTLPIVSSPMDTITGVKMSAAMFSMGGFGIIHRYNTVEEQSNMVRAAVKAGAFLVGGAVGVSGDYLERTKELVAAGCSVVCIDVARGHQVLR